MSLFHHHDADKEFVSWIGCPYDARMSWIASSLILAAHHRGAGGPAASVPGVGIVLDVDPGLPPAIQDLAVVEAARVWAPYRVAVTLRKTPAVVSSEHGGAVVGRATGAAVASDDGVVESVRLDSFRRRPAGAARLPALRGDRPGDRRQRRVGSARRAVAAGLRERILGRIVGRVLAHEIGHFVLRSPRHASRGLMRPFQSITDLIAGNGEIFGLTPEDLNLLRSAITLQGVVADVDAGG